MKQWCEHHWALIRDAQPRANGLHAALLLSQRALVDERFMRAAGWNPETGALADADRINEIMAKFSPICCFVGDEAVSQIVAEATVIAGRA